MNAPSDPFRHRIRHRRPRARGWGRKEINIAESEMPALMAIRAEYAASQPLAAHASPAACT